MSYWSLPDEAMDLPQAMLPWARLAFDAVRKANAVKRLRKRATMPTPKRN